MLTDYIPLKFEYKMRIFFQLKKIHLFIHQKSQNAKGSYFKKKYLKAIHF